MLDPKAVAKTSARLAVVVGIAIGAVIAVGSVLLVEVISWLVSS
jgi:hypothetical protein